MARVEKGALERSELGEWLEEALGRRRIVLFSIPPPLKGTPYRRLISVTHVGA